MTRTIRAAMAEDCPLIEAIVVAAYSGYVPRIGRKPGPMLDNYAAHIRRGNIHVLEIAGVIHGLVVLIRERDAMLLDNVAVRPGSQGMGHGRTLLEFAERSAREAGCSSLKLYTNEAMTENLALYSRIGFVETHRAEEAGLRRVYMTKPLVQRAPPREE